MVDFGSSASVSQSIKMHKAALNIENKLREFTIGFASPELLRRYKDPYLDINIILSSLDVYCWGVCFLFFINAEERQRIDQRQ